MTEEFTVELSDNQSALVKRAADLLDVTPEQYLRDAAINRNEAVNNALQRQATRQRGQN